MAYPQGINFRASAGFVTDAAPATYELGGAGATYPRTTPQGNTVGWEVPIGNTRDRTTANDTRLAGIHFLTAPGVFRFDLPSAGSYNLRAAFGDPSSVNATAWTLLDNSTVLATLATGTNSAANSFRDATNTLRTAAAWPTSNAALPVTFGTTICRVRSDSTASNMIAHLYVEQAAAGGPSSTGALSATLGAMTGTSSGSTQVSGQSANQLAGISLSAAGTVAATGQAAGNLGGVSLVASGAASTGAAVASTLDGMAVASAGGASISGTVAGTLAGLHGVISGAVAVHGVAGSTFGTLTLAATAGVAEAEQSTPAITGALSATFAAMTVSGASANGVKGSAAAQMAGCTVVSSGTVTSVASVAATLGGIALQAAGGVLTQAGAQSTFDAIQLVAIGGSGVFKRSEARTYAIPAETRQYCIAPENRILKVI